MPEKAWGEGCTQHDFMLKDECLVLNYNDEVIGSDNKYNVHKFIAGQPKGVVHRAFSVMLFDAEGRLLLQQRAASKVTFPKVWTNTCCSHPLHGQTPEEVDATPTSEKDEPTGVKNAAVRKLLHELGIPIGTLEPSRFKYMGRVHYWAADCVTHGADAPWGEHEVDYLLIAKLKKGEACPMTPNPDEVMAVKWVSEKELKEGMARGSDMELWSPWFRTIANDAELLGRWWQDLDGAFKLKPYLPIKRFDAPPEHCKPGPHTGAASTELSDLYAAEQKLAWASAERKALTLRLEREARRRDLTMPVGVVDPEKKQGAYGKVPTHSHSKLDQLSRVDEVVAALRLKFGGSMLKALPAQFTADDVVWCDVKLGEVSRSFAAVIRQLPPTLVLDILIFYLVLRALDTIEDDMAAFKDDISVKIKHLNAFGSDVLGDEAWSMSGVGEGAERELLEGFGKVSKVFNGLPAASQGVIRDVTVEMGQGMAEYVHADLGQGTKTAAEYDRYCHFVAGLVGEGLTRIFVARGMEGPALAGQGMHVWPFCKGASEVADGVSTLGLSNSMGLFLQKCNIIRDYFEDYVDDRAFWPREVWRQFARTDELGEFARPSAHGGGLGRYPKAFDATKDPKGGAWVAKGCNTSALACLNFLVADALELIPDCLEYLSLLKTPEVFKFCAIPQVSDGDGDREPPFGRLCPSSLWVLIIPPPPVAPNLPQVMAIATLEQCFDNPKVFSGVVKVRKGQAARLMLDAGELPSVHAWFHHYAKRIAKRCPPDDPSREKILAATAVVERLTASAYNDGQRRRAVMVTTTAAALGAIAYVSL